MNERIRQFAEQAGILFDTETVPETGFKYQGAMISDQDLEQFAELIVRECAEQVDWILAEGGKTQGDLIKQHFGVAE
jgi:fructose-1-phosphate kinase PfkB-like protein